MVASLELFLLGAMGALLTVYLAKQEIIPEFRPFFDTADMERETTEHQDHIKMTEKNIDDIQTKLIKESVSSDLTQRLTTVLNASLPELQTERLRLQTLEKEIMQGRIVSRALGFLFYIVLGGVFGYLLGDNVTIKGVSDEHLVPFQAILIGATWTTYLSIIGFKSVQEKAKDRIEDIKREVDGKNKELKEELTPQVEETVEKAERSEKTDHPILAGKAAKLVTEKIDESNMDMQKKLDVARQMIQKDVKGFL